MEPVGGGGGVLVSNNYFLPQNTSLLELYFINANSVRTRRQWQSTLNKERSPMGLM